MRKSDLKGRISRSRRIASVFSAGGALKGAAQNL